MDEQELKATYRKQQISQWDFAPEGAFQVFRDVDTGLSKATCQFVFYERSTNKPVMNDCPAELKTVLATIEPQL